MSFRPKNFNEVLGQDKVKQRLSISINAALNRKEPLAHCLMDGGPGLGKTTLAGAIAHEMKSDLIIANGANLRTIKAIMPYLMSLKTGDVFFIDEIHRTTPIVQEFLYPVMEDFWLHFTGEDDANLSRPMPRFTMVAATTDAGKLAAPLFDRFKIKVSLELYSINDLKTLIKKNAERIKLNLLDCGAETIAKASRGTPRIANARLEWVRDYSSSTSANKIDKGIVMQALELEGISENGMTPSDRKYLSILKQANKPLGIKTLSLQTNISEVTIEEVIEPFLLRQGLIRKTPRGREVVSQSINGE